MDLICNDQKVVSSFSSLDEREKWYQWLWFFWQNRHTFYSMYFSAAELDCMYYWVWNDIMKKVIANLTLVMALITKVSSWFVLL